MKLEDLLKLYLSDLKANGKAESTIRNARSRLNYFFTLAHLNDITAVKFDHLVKFLNEPNKAPNTLFGRDGALRHFFNWAHEENYLLKNPMLAIERPKRKRNLPTKIMTQGETLKFLESIPLDVSHPSLYRDRVMLELMYSCSLRCSELVALNLNDYEPTTRSLRIAAGKTYRGRLVPVGKYVSELVETYLKEIRPQSKSEALFITERNKDRLKSNTITNKVWKFRKKVNIKTKASSHSFRKSSATHMLRNGASLLNVQALLGHAAITSTQVYTKVYPKDLIKMHRAYHPRERHKNLKCPELKTPEYLYAKVKFNPS